MHRNLDTGHHASIKPHMVVKARVQVPFLLLLLCGGTLLHRLSYTRLDSSVGSSFACPAQGFGFKPGRGSRISWVTKDVSQVPSSAKELYLCLMCVPISSLVKEPSGGTNTRSAA